MCVIPITTLFLPWNQLLSWSLYYHLSASLIILFIQVYIPKVLPGFYLIRLLHFLNNSLPPVHPFLFSLECIYWRKWALWPIVSEVWVSWTVCSQCSTIYSSVLCASCNWKMDPEVLFRVVLFGKPISSIVFFLSGGT